jgi:hypothetical protein
MSLTPDEPIYKIIHSNLHMTSEHAPERTEHERCSIQIYQVQTKSHVELED